MTSIKAALRPKKPVMGGTGKKATLGQEQKLGQQRRAETQPVRRPTAERQQDIANKHPDRLWGRNTPKAIGGAACMLKSRKKRSHEVNESG